MHYLVIWQSDEDVRPILQPLFDLGANTQIVERGGNYWRTYEMQSQGSPKGFWFDQQLIFTVIMDTARDALNRGERLGEMEVVFMFHQTNSQAVAAITLALQILSGNLLDNLSVAEGKDLNVPKVTLLSCESATDKTAPDPVPGNWQRWVTQASQMRQACFGAFTITGPSGQTYEPTVVTFSTGNPETGGISLHPWHAQFFSLNGHFNPDGTWSYNTDANGQADTSHTPVGGTVYFDTPSGPNTTQALQPNEHLHSILPALP